MSDEIPQKTFGSFRRALFQDVPLVLDSLWRQWEFKVNRVGLVDLSGDHELIQRSGISNWAFLLFIAVSFFVIFGPTLDAMCTPDDAETVHTIRKGSGFALVILSGFAGLMVANAAFDRLRRRGEQLVEEACATNEETRKRREAMLASFAKIDASLAGVKRVTGNILERLLGNSLRIWGMLPFMRFTEWLALFLAALVLLFGSALLVLPFVSLGIQMTLMELDPMSCTQAANSSFIAAQGVGFLALAVGGVAIWWRWGKNNALAVFAASTALMALVIGLLWWLFTPDSPSEAVGGFYPHIYVILVGILLVTALLAYPLSRLMFSRFRREYAPEFRAKVPSQDLLHPQDDLLYPKDVLPDPTKVRLWSALITGVKTHFLHFLLLPAFVEFLGTPDKAKWVTPAFAVVSAVLVMYSSMSSRWGQVLAFTDRWFLVGAPLVVSIGVIVIAILRYANVQYVATVMNAAPLGVLVIIVGMLYAAVWLFEYWINRWLAQELLAIVGDEKHIGSGYAPSPYDAEENSWAQRSGRYIGIHGIGRFCAYGWFSREKPQDGERADDYTFTTYSFSELFEAVGSKIKNGVDLSRDVERRVGLYFNLINLFVLLAFVVAWNLLTPAPMDVSPMVDVKAIEAEQLPQEYEKATVEAAGSVDSLAKRLTPEDGKSNEAIIVAASGGGTRAAVYTAVALEGVAKLGRTHDVTLLSGVSGGGMSAAVYASRFQSLVDAIPTLDVKNEKDPWHQYIDVVTKPYIQDVLEGIGELRILRDVSLGALLKESFDRRAFGEKIPVRRFGQITGPALILNSAISGHPYDDSEMLFGRVAPPRGGDKADCSKQASPYANLAGGRLIFTNLDNLKGFPKRTGDAPDMLLPYRIVNSGDVELAAASALTANFPPVFSNAHVRLAAERASNGEDPCAKSYFVTDGGATENLGLVSALYALRGTLEGLPAKSKIRDIHILALEASAIDYDYKDDRGIGAATGGSKERINAGLTQMLLDDVRGLMCAHNAKLSVHYLPLPVAFRSRGGFGTHWMFAQIVRVANPHLSRLPKDKLWSRSKHVDFVDLKRPETLRTLRAMYDTSEPMCEKAERLQKLVVEGKKAEDPQDGWTESVQRVARWICGYDDDRKTHANEPDFQVKAWQSVIEDLGRGQPVAPRTAPLPECKKPNAEDAPAETPPPEAAPAA